MVLDIGITQWVIKKLNRWYRNRLRPHGQPDLLTRTISLRYTRRHVIVQTFVAGTLLTFFVCTFFLYPTLFADEPTWKRVGLFIGWCGIALAAVAVLADAYAGRWIISDEGISRRIGGLLKWTVRWREIQSIEIDWESDEIKIRGMNSASISISFAVDGYEDLAHSLINNSPAEVQEHCAAHLEAWLEDTRRR